MQFYSHWGNKIDPPEDFSMSSYPEDQPIEDEWTEPTDPHVCECGMGMWTAGWWDDPSDAGGACIGTLYQCGDCGCFMTQ